MKAYSSILVSFLFSFVLTGLTAQDWNKELLGIDESYRIGDYISAAKKNSAFKKKLEKKMGDDNEYMIQYYLKAARNNLANGYLVDYENHISKANELSGRVFKSSSKEHAYTLLDITDLMLSFGNYKRAEFFLNQAVELLEKQGTVEGDDKARVAFASASIYSGKGFYNKALEFIDENRDYYRSRAVSKESFIDPGNGKLKTKKLSDAEIYKRFGDYAELLSLTARTLWKKGNFNGADSAFVRAEQWIQDQKELGKSSLGYVRTLVWHWQMLEEYGVDTKESRRNFEDALYQLKRNHVESHHMALWIYERLLKNYLANNDEARYKNLRSEYENVITRFFNTASLHNVNLEVVELDSRLDRAKLRNLEARALDLLYNENSLPTYHPKRIQLLDFVYMVAITDRNYSSAESYLNDMLEIRKVLYGEESPEYHLGRIQLGIYFLNYTNKFEEANKIFEESFYAVVNPEINEWHVDYVEILNNLAIYYESTDQYQKASDVLDKALTQTRKLYTNTDLNYGIELEIIARLQIKIGEYAKAQNNLNEAITILENERRNNQTVIFYVKALETSARLKSIQGLLGDAESELRLSDRMFLRADNLIGYDGLKSSVEMSDLFINFGRYAETEETLKEAIDQYIKLFGTESRNLVLPYVNMGYLMVTKGDFNVANDYATKASRIAETIFGTNSTKTAPTYTLRAEINNSLGDYEQAERNIVRAIEIQEAEFGRNHIDVAKSLATLGVIKLYKGDDPAEIESIILESKKIIKDLLGETNPLYAGVLTELAELYITSDRHPEAFDLLNEAFNIWEISVDKTKNVEKAEIFTLRGDVYYFLKNYKEAEVNYNEAKSLYDRFFKKDHPEYVKVISKLSKVYYMEGDTKKAREFINEALGNYDNFIQKYFKALSEREKAKYWAKIRGDYEFFNTLALELMAEFPGMRHQMTDNALTTKALLLNSSLKIRQRILASNDPELISQYNQWINKKEYLTQVLSMSIEQLTENEIDPVALNDEVEQLERDISEKSELFKQSFDETKITWSDVKGALKSNEVAIEMVRFRYFDHVFTDSVIYAGLLVKNDPAQKEPEVILINNGSELEQKYFKYYRNSIYFKVKDKYSYEYFWKPIVEKVGAYSTIYLSADGVYNQINLEAIPTGDDKYVIDNSNIILVSNTKDIAIRERSQSVTRPNNDATMFGNPTFYLSASSSQSSGVGQLPGTETEINQLNSLLRSNGWVTNAYLENQATEEKVKSLNNPKVFHIATHGFFKPQDDLEANAEAIGSSSSSASQNPLLRTGLMLSGAGDLLDLTNFNFNMDNGILTAYEAMNLNLDETDLVVLSACETGLGDLTVGEGVYGLQRAFIVAGAKTLIMSMFKVNDEATQKLMVNFYQKWLASGDMRQAFVDAKKELRNEFKEPIYWGAFIMIGLD